jgi:hypothetical protein
MDGRYAGNAGAITGDGHGWPGPRVPEEVIRRTAEKYAEALRKLAGIVLD